ncbi:hypothetical protein J8J40_25680 [Mycobacterium tuberculosis]|nr:hypothetical protein [Mycobacterium tuberculosis]
MTLPVRVQLLPFGPVPERVDVQWPLPSQEPLPVRAQLSPERVVPLRDQEQLPPC